MSPPRWPLHPQPHPLEALSSWLRRIADLYQLTVRELLAGNLGLPGHAMPGDLDRDPPAAMLAALAERTGVDLARIRAMTLAGWRPWLLDTLDTPPNAKITFGNYVHAHSVLLHPRARGTHSVARHLSWRGPWLPRERTHRMCPVCATLPDRGPTLLSRLPLMVSCGEHGCRLEDANVVEFEMLVRGRALTPRPVPEPLAALDRYTHQALLTGRVDLPGRSVHAGVWFRLLRTLLHELSLSLPSIGIRGRRTIELIWQTAGHPLRAGLGAWRPYEVLAWPTQETMLHAAAVALQLAADGRITAYGVLGTAIQPTTSHRVYDGDRRFPVPHLLAPPPLRVDNSDGPGPHRASRRPGVLGTDHHRLPRPEVVPTGDPVPATPWRSGRLPARCRRNRPALSRGIGVNVGWSDDLVSGDKHLGPVARP